MVRVWRIGWRLHESSALEAVIINLLVLLFKLLVLIFCVETGAILICLLTSKTITPLH